MERYIIYLPCEFSYMNRKTEEMKQILLLISTLYYYQADRRKATAILHIQSLVRGFLARRRVRRQARGWLETLQVMTGSNWLQQALNASSCLQHSG